jgi:fucose 4-O-acetylase-like acetyltransferase
MILKSELEELLSNLRKARSILVEEFVSENPDIFTAMFKYDNDNVVMNMYIDCYFITWLNYHLEVFSCFNAKSVSCRNWFLSCMSDLISKYLKGVNTDSHVYKRSEFAYTLLEKKKAAIMHIIKCSDSNKLKYNKLVYAVEKDKKLFEREIAKLKEEA